MDSTQTLYPKEIFWNFKVCQLISIFKPGEGTDHLTINLFRFRKIFSRNISFDLLKLIELNVIK